MLKQKKWPQLFKQLRPEHPLFYLYISLKFLFKSDKIIPLNFLLIPLYRSTVYIV